MSDRRPKAADIPDERLLRAVLEVWEEKTMWTNTSDLEERVPGFPPKVLVAKAGQLIKRKMLSGCTCGCRGDFELKQRGMDFLLDCDATLLTALLDYSDSRSIPWQVPPSPVPNPASHIEEGRETLKSNKEKR